MLGQPEHLEALPDGLEDDLLERPRGVFAELPRVRVVAVRHAASRGRVLKEIPDCVFSDEGRIRRTSKFKLHGYFCLGRWPCGLLEF